MLLTKGNKALKLQDSKDKNQYPWAGIGPGLADWHEHLHAAICQAPGWAN